MILKSSEFIPHPQGIHGAVCVDVLDLGLIPIDVNGQSKMVHKVRLVFESEQKLEDGRNFTVSKNFTASLHPKSKLNEFLGHWRGRPVLRGEVLDLARLIGACCTLVVSHKLNDREQSYASIDAVSRPTRKLTPSGHYDPAKARERLAKRRAQVAQAAANGGRGTTPAEQTPARGTTPAPATATGFDPEVGF